MRVVRVIVDYVSKHPICRPPVVVYIEAELLDARPAFVLGKPHLDVASNLRARLDRLGHLAAAPSSSDLRIPGEPYADVVAHMRQGSKIETQRDGERQT